VREQPQPGQDGGQELAISRSAKRMAAGEEGAAPRQGAAAGRIGGILLGVSIVVIDIDRLTKLVRDWH